MITRRETLKIALLAGVSIPLGGLPLTSFAAEKARKSHDLEAFLGLSRSLTGFENLDQELAEHYADYLAKADGWGEFLAVYHKLNRQGKPISSETMNTVLKSSEPVSDLAKRIIKLWYSGWTDNAPGITEEVRAKAYNEALAWRAMNLSTKGVPTGRLWQDPV